MSTNKVLLIALSLFGAIALGFLVGNRSDKGSPVPVVRTYMVPIESGDEIKAQINRLFENKEADPIARAQVFANGLLVLRAPESIQAGVQKFIDQMGTTKSIGRTAIHLDYWLVDGQADKISNAETFPALTSVLTAITQTDGPRRFRVLEHLSTNSQSGQKVEIKGAVSEARSVATQANGFVKVNLEYLSKMGSVKSDTQVKAGEFLILGQNAMLASNAPAQEAHLQGTKIATGNVYYIIRATLAQ